MGDESDEIAEMDVPLSMFASGEVIEMELTLTEEAKKTKVVAQFTQSCLHIHKYVHSHIHYHYTCIYTNVCQNVD